MAGTNITRAGTNIMTRNEYYSILTFRPERFLPGTNIMRQGRDPGAVEFLNPGFALMPIHTYPMSLLEEK